MLQGHRRKSIFTARYPLGPHVRGNYWMLPNKALELIAFSGMEHGRFYEV
jgi:hypothetical protein